MHPPSLAQAFLYWLKLGCTSFGGPAGQIALMHQSLVHDKKWISEDRFLHALNFCILLPGPEAQQLAIYMGWLLHKTIGGLIAGILFVLPAFFILCGLAYVYINYGELGLVRGFFAGVKPVIVALVLFAGFRMGIKTLNKHHLASISVLAFIGLFLTLPFPLILLMAGLAGLVMNRQSKLSKMLPSSALQDSTFLYPDWLQSLKTLTIGVMVIVGGLILMTLIFGLDHLFVKTAWFYTKAAFLTFGGAYAVLPYVFQGAVDHYQWITSQQMLDALALGETTPGPLIMVITFISFLSGWSHIALPNLTPLYSGLIVAMIATLFTFIPSFLMIFLGAPLIEHTRNIHYLTGPLSAISAAVVGMIVHLGITLANHTLWHIESLTIDWMNMAIAIIAFIALQRYKVNTLFVILASGLLGLARASNLLT